MSQNAHQTLGCSAGVFLRLLVGLLDGELVALEAAGELGAFFGGNGRGTGG